MIPDYGERVYAGVLGKLIGVYLGRPFEGWTADRIEAELGDIAYYVRDAGGRPLVVADDDITGTFTFLRALDDHGCRPDLSARQVGETWLNYVIEGRSVFWWGGVGTSTEHTAYRRLRDGVPAPESGSIARNGRVIAEQIGAQIFIDGWGLVAPGDPELAARLAGEAARVSHDGAAVDAARLLAAMVAQAFVEPDIDALLDAGLALLPPDSVIVRLIVDLREWRGRHTDWRDARSLVQQRYGYDRYPGNCHVVPNHALVIMALLWGGGDFQHSLLIANTSGWDTDCNSGNVGCLLGVRGGLAAIDAGPDWRGPVADRLYLPTADGGAAITDAAREASRIVGLASRLGSIQGQERWIAPKNGARFHFAFPGSVQGFQVDETSPDSRGVASVENRAGRLSIDYRRLAPGRVARVMTPTFVPPEALDLPGYRLMASPTLHPGQRLRARLAAAEANLAPVSARLVLRAYVEADVAMLVPGPETCLAPGETGSLEWVVPDTKGAPVVFVGVEARTELAGSGTVYLESLTWDGEPAVELGPAERGGTSWRRAWVDAVDQWSPRWPEPYRLVQNRGTGMLAQGGRDWRDYRVSATVTLHMAEGGGIAARVQGLRRWYGLLIAAGAGVGDDADQGHVLQLCRELDGERTVLAELRASISSFQEQRLALEAHGPRLRAWLGGRLVFDIEDAALDAGGVGLICEEGTVAIGAVRIDPAR